MNSMSLRRALLTVPGTGSGILVEKKMIGCLSLHRRTMSSCIARHKSARQRRVAAEGSASSAWKFVHCPALIFFRWREKRAFSHLVMLAPTNANDARQKLVYLMAVMMADPTTPAEIGIANAIKTLKPFIGTLVHCLSKRRERRFDDSLL